MARPSRPSVRLTAWVVASTTHSERPYHNHAGTGPNGNSTIGCGPATTRNTTAATAVKANFGSARSPRFFCCRIPMTSSHAPIAMQPNTSSASASVSRRGCSTSATIGAIANSSPPIVGVPVFAW